MGRVSTFHTVRVVEASQAVVWSVLVDYPGMTRWAGATSVTMERSGAGDSRGVGAIRVLKSWRGTIREEITEFDPERRMGYRILSGVPADNYHGVIELTPSDGSTRIAWTNTFEPRTLAGPVVGAVIKSVVQGIVDRFVRVVSSGGQRSTR